jgi:hypothetical protein
MSFAAPPVEEHPADKEESDQRYFYNQPGHKGH